MNTSTTTLGSAKRSRPAGLDSVLDKRWNADTQLVISREFPPDPSQLTASAKFAQAVLGAAPQWVMLRLPPQTREAAKRLVAALRRRDLNAVMRCHPDATTSWSIWDSAKKTSTNACGDLTESSASKNASQDAA